MRARRLAASSISQVDRVSLHETVTNEPATFLKVVILFWKLVLTAALHTGSDGSLAEINSTTFQMENTVAVYGELLWNKFSVCKVPY